MREGIKRWETAGDEKKVEKAGGSEWKGERCSGNDEELLCSSHSVALQNSNPYIHESMYECLSRAESYVGKTEKSLKMITGLTTLLGDIQG